MIIFETDKNKENITVLSKQWGFCFQFFYSTVAIGSYSVDYNISYKNL